MLTDSKRTKFIIYDDTGKITGEYQNFARYAEIDLAGKNYIEYKDNIGINSYYVDVNTNEVKPRPEMDLIVYGNIISNIPAGAIIKLGDQEFQIDDGEAEIEGYTGVAKVTCWPYLDEEVMVGEN